MELEFTHSVYADIIDKFKERAFDIIVVGDFERLNSNLFEIKYHSTGYIDVVVSKEHCFAAKQEVLPEDLLNETLICLNLYQNRLAYLCSMDRIRNICGCLPTKVKYVQDTETADMYVESGLGYMLMVSSLKEIYKPNCLSFIKINAPKQTMPVVIAWRKDNDNPALQLFANIVNKKIAQTSSVV